MFVGRVVFDIFRKMCCEVACRFFPRVFISEKARSRILSRSGTGLFLFLLLLLLNIIFYERTSATSPLCISHCVKNHLWNKAIIIFSARRCSELKIRWSFAVPLPAAAALRPRRGGILDICKIRQKHDETDWVECAMYIYLGSIFNLLNVKFLAGETTRDSEWAENSRGRERRRK